MFNVSYSNGGSMYDKFETIEEVNAFIDDYILTGLKHGLPKIEIVERKEINILKERLKHLRVECLINEHDFIEIDAIYLADFIEKVLKEKHSDKYDNVIDYNIFYEDFGVRWNNEELVSHWNEGFQEDEKRDFSQTYQDILNEKLCDIITLPSGIIVTWNL